MVAASDRQTFLRLLVCSVCGILAVSPSTTTAQTRSGSVKLWPAAVVVEDVIRLGDVAQLRGFDLESEPSLLDLVINSAPEPGGSRIVTLATVREVLGAAGVNRASVIIKGAAECAVRRPAQAVPPPSEPSSPTESRSGDKPASTRTLRDAVMSYFDQQMAAYDGQADVDFGRTSVQMLDLAEPQFHFRINRRSGPNIGLIHLEAVVLRGAQAVQRIPMVVNVTLVRDVVVARKPINRDATVRADDVHTVPWRFTRADRTGLTDPGEVIGLRAQRFMAPGELIAPQDLERVPLVKRGQIVEVLSRFGGVTVKTAAKVSEDGDYGNFVTLHLQGRRKSRILARVLGPRRVLVDDAVLPDDGEIKLAHGGSR